MGCCALLQGIFPNQESNPYLQCLLNFRQVLNKWTTWGSPAPFEPLQKEGNWQRTLAHFQNFPRPTSSFLFWSCTPRASFSDFWCLLVMPKRWCCESAALNMSANLENSAVATGLEMVSFHSNLKKGNAKECSSYHTFALIWHASKVMLKILQARLQQYVNRELQMFKLVLEKAEEPEIKLPTSAGSSKKQESSRKTFISALLTMSKPLTVWITINWKILKEMGIPDHLTCLLRNLYAGQNATVRTGHGTTDWFQIGKGVRQVCISSPCLFNIYAEYIMRNSWAGWSTSWNQDCQKKEQ